MNGKDGATGPAGPQGAIGPAGANGAVGVTGPLGPVGPMGVAGPPGPQGSAGMNLVNLPGSIATFSAEVGGPTGSATLGNSQVIHTTGGKPLTKLVVLCAF